MRFVCWNEPDEHRWDLRLRREFAAEGRDLCCHLKHRREGRELSAGQRSDSAVGVAIRLDVQFPDSAINRPPPGFVTPQLREYT